MLSKGWGFCLRVFSETENNMSYSDRNYQTREKDHERGKIFR